MIQDKEAIRDFGGRIIGYVETKPNGDKIVRDFGGRVLGRYIKSQNVTKDFHGRIISRGDNVGMLLSFSKN